MEYALSTSVNPSRSGSISPSSSTYDAGRQVTLISSPASGYRFDHWGGDASGTSTSMTLTMDWNRSVVAYFGSMIVITHPLPFLLSILHRHLDPSFKSLWLFCHSPSDRANELLHFLEHLLLGRTQARI